MNWRVSSGRARGSTARAALFVLLATLVGPVAAAPGASAVTGDIAEPVLVELVIQPREIDTTSQDVTVSFRAHVTDDLAGVEWVRFQPNSPGGQQTMPGFGRLVSGDALDGWWEGSVVFRRGTEPGRWQAWVSFADRATNMYTGWPERLAEDGHDGHIDVTNSAPDITAPRVNALSVSPALVDVREGSATTTVEFRVSDDTAGATEVYLNLLGPDGRVPQADRTYPARFSGDENDGWWRSVVTVPEFSHSGHWTFMITLVDGVGNRRDYRAAELAEAGLTDGFDVVSVDDLHAPILESLTVRPIEANVAESDQVVEFELVVSDDVSGVDYLQLDVRHPVFAQEHHPQFTLVEGDRMRGRYRGRVTFPRHSATGPWTIGMLATDKAANWEWLQSPDLIARGFLGVVLIYNVPTPPLDLIAAPDVGGVLDVSWQPPSDDRGKPVDGFRVEVEPAGIAIDVDAATTSVRVDGLLPGDYEVTVAAHNVAGYSTPTVTIASVRDPGREPASEYVPEPSPPPYQPPPQEDAPMASTDPTASVAGTSGYWMVRSDGHVHAFGDAAHLGSPRLGRAPAVDVEATPSGAGYWVVDADGTVYAMGDAQALGGAPVTPGEKVVSLSSTNTGAGYWIFTSHGRVVPFGDAAFLGDMSAVPLNGPVLDSITTPSGRGYYMVAADGGVFTFGDAQFAGSMGGTRLNAPVQSLVPDVDGDGYWLVASDGGIFAFNAPFYGSMGAVVLNRPVTGMVGSPSGDGYLMVAEDGGIFSFGDVPFHGSLGAAPPPSPVVAVASV